MTTLAVPQNQDLGLTVRIEPCGPSKLQFPRNTDILPTHGGHVLQRRHHSIYGKTIIANLLCNYEKVFSELFD